MSRCRCAKSVAWISSLLIAANNMLIVGIGHAQDHCGDFAKLKRDLEIDVYKQPTGSDRVGGTKPTRVGDLGEISCLGEEKNSRYHIRTTAKGDGWVPSWEVAKSGPGDPLQQLLRSPNDFAAPIAQQPSRGADSSIAVSPRNAPGQSSTALPPSESPKIEDLLHRGGEPPSIK
jgi:hypothetical protein